MIAVLLLVIYASRFTIITCAEIVHSDPITQIPLNHHHRRHLLSSVPGGTNNQFPRIDTLGPVYRAQRDWIDHSNHVPEPDLYYQDLDDGERLLIWSYYDTLPRDVLAGRPEVWLYVVMDVARDAAILPHFLEHYSRLGVSAQRMIFTLQFTIPSLLDPTSSSVLLAKLKQRVESTLNSFGADHRLQMVGGHHSLDDALEALLLATHRIPIKDWIVSVQGCELVDFQGATVQQFLERRDREGANWVSSAAIPQERLSPQGLTEPVTVRPPTPLSSQFFLSCTFKDLATTKVVAFRGFLRPDACHQHIIPAEKAASYFGASARGEESPRDGSTCGTKDLYDLTPYSKWWEYYKTPLMVGNAYLWYEREADDKAVVSRYRWHSSSSSSFLAAAADNGEDETEDGCQNSRVEEEERRQFEELKNEMSKFRKDEGGTTTTTKLTCRDDAIYDEGSLLRRLPLSKQSAIALATILQNYYK